MCAAACIVCVSATRPQSHSKSHSGCILVQFSSKPYIPNTWQQGCMGPAGSLHRALKRCSVQRGHDHAIPTAFALVQHLDLRAPAWRSPEELLGVATATPCGHAQVGGRRASSMCAQCLRWPLPVTCVRGIVWAGSLSMCRGGPLNASAHASSTAPKVFLPSLSAQAQQH